MPAEPITIRVDRLPPRWQYRAWQLLAPRLPHLSRVLMARVVLHLPPGSRARRWWVLNVAVMTWDATARGRYDLALPVWDRECEWRWSGDFVALGFDELYRGHEGVKRCIYTWNTLWTERSFTVGEILDGGGNTFLMRVTLSGRGARSGVPVELKISAVARLKPLLVAYQNYLDDAEALREAGFGPSARPTGP